MSFPTRVRRFLSRFLIVIIVSLSIEFLVVVFELIHDDPSHLPEASAIGLATATLLAAWGIFVRLNKSAEELEPEAMQEVKGEDIKIKRDELNS
jgi:glycopeptide antibiotics resistance protein